MTIRFAAIRTLYQEREDRCKADLGRLEGQRAGLVHAVTAIVAERQSALAGPVAPQLRDQLLAFCAASQQRERMAVQTLSAHDARIAEARSALATAHRDRTTIEKLQERDRTVARQRSERREQRELDEFAARIHSQRATGT